MVQLRSLHWIDTLTNVEQLQLNPTQPNATQNLNQFPNKQASTQTMSARYPQLHRTGGVLYAKVSFNQTAKDF